MTVKLTKDDVQEVQHKLGVLQDTPDLMLDYNMTEEQAVGLIQSLPRDGGNWEVPMWAIEILCGEMQNHAQILHGIASDCRHDIGQSLKIARQANKFERIFVNP